MEQLIHYLIENRYADNKTSAQKILSAISDEFYNQLVESATEELSRLNAKFRQIMRDGGDLTKIAAQIKAAKQASAQNYEERGKPREQKAPRTISGGKGPQTPKDGERGQRYSREGSPIGLDTIGTKLTGMPAEPRPLSAKVRPGVQTQNAPGRDPTVRNVSGETTTRPGITNTASNLGRQLNRHGRL